MEDRAICALGQFGSRAFQIQDKSRDYDPHLDQTKFNELLLLTIDGVLVCEVHLKEMEVQINFPASTSSGCRVRDRNGTVAKVDFG